MPDTVHHVMWYTVYDAKTGYLIASGTSKMCARRRAYKYIFEKECIRRDEVDSLPPVRTIRKKPARAPTRTSSKGDEFCRPSPQK